MPLSPQEETMKGVAKMLNKKNSNSNNSKNLFVKDSDSRSRLGDGFSVKSSTAHLFSLDLAHMFKNIEPDVFFEFEAKDRRDDKIFRLHSAVLKARSKWFKEGSLISKSSDDSEDITVFDRKVQEQKSSTDKKLNKRDEDYNYQRNHEHHPSCTCYDKKKFEDEDSNRNFPIANFEIDAYDIEVVAVSEKIDREKYHFKISYLSPQVFHECVKFLYSGNCYLNNENAIDLLRCAYIFGIKTLKDEINSYLLKNIEDFLPDDLIKLYVLAVKCRKAQLEAKCADLINENAYIIINTNEWKNLEKNYPNLIVNLFYDRNRL